MSAISFGRPFVASQPPGHTGDAHRLAGLNARHVPPGPDTGVMRQPIAMPKPAGGDGSPPARKPASPYPLPECLHLPGTCNKPRLVPAKMPMVCAPPEYRDPGFYPDLPKPTFPNHPDSGFHPKLPQHPRFPNDPDPGFFPKLPDEHPLPGDRGLNPIPLPDDCAKPDQRPGWPDCVPWPCGDDTSRTSVTPIAKPAWHVLDTGPCGPDEVKIVIHENGSATVTVNGTDYDYPPHTAQDLRVIVDKNDNVQIQDRRSYEDRMREPQPVQIAPRS